VKRFFKYSSRLSRINVFRFRKELHLMRNHPDAFDVYKRLAATKKRALSSGSAATDAIAEALRCGNRAVADQQVARLGHVFDVIETVDDATRALLAVYPQAMQASGPASTYVVSSWFLASCAETLLADPQGHERLHFVTGVRVGTHRTLDRMVPVPIESQSSIHAAADQTGAQQALLELDAWGHTVHGLFHSHPGQGREATRPSSTDLATHERYERGGYPLIGAIVVRDGFVRFFSHHSDFTITIFGEGVTQIDTRLFQFKDVPGSSPDATGNRGGAGVGSARALVRIRSAGAQ
jgi:proteasome lid subunit RPN8/RPN11